MIYIATPYTHADRNIREKRFQIVSQYSARLLSQGKFVFSPITHGHVMAKYEQLTDDSIFWFRYNHKFLEICESMHVLKIEGYEKSKGLAMELQHFDRNQKPIQFIDIKEHEYSLL